MSCDATTSPTITARSSTSLTITLTGTNDAPSSAANVNAGRRRGASPAALPTSSDVDDGAELTFTPSGAGRLACASTPTAATASTPTAAYHHLASVTADLVAETTRSPTSIGALTPARSRSRSPAPTTRRSQSPTPLPDRSATITGTVATNDSDVDDSADLHLRATTGAIGRLDDRYRRQLHLRPATRPSSTCQARPTDLVADLQRHRACTALRTSTVTITITGTNDAAVAAADATLAGNTALTGTAADQQRRRRRRRLHAARDDRRGRRPAIDTDGS